MLLSGRRQQSPFQSLHESVGGGPQLQQVPSHACRPLTKRYVLACAERRIVLAGKESLSPKVW
jgi:hypothetical protein